MIEFVKKKPIYRCFQTNGDYSPLQNKIRQPSSTRKGNRSLEHAFFRQLQFGLYIGAEHEGAIEVKVKEENVDNEFLNMAEDVTRILRSLYFDNWQCIVKLVFYNCFSKFSK